MDPLPFGPSKILKNKTDGVCDHLIRDYIIINEQVGHLEKKGLPTTSSDLFESILQQHLSHFIINHYLYVFQTLMMCYRPGL